MSGTTTTTQNPTTFNDLNLIAPILKAVKAEGYEKPTPIQQQAIPRILTKGDLLACAQTGTGKTAAFALPILQLLAERDAQALHKPRVREIRVLVLTPTRELASQIGESFDNYGRDLHLNNTVIFGGVGQNPQAAAIRKGVDIVVATPGRLLDLINQRLVRFNALEIFVLDEADRMLDMGFIHDVRRIINVIPKQRQTLFFSATMPPEISKLADQILTKPTRVEVTPVASTVELISQSVYHLPENQKTSMLVKCLGEPGVERSIVFTRTKRDANRVSDSLNAAGIGSAAIHGNKSQGARERALEGVKTGDVRVLVATDIAARGIDIDGITHVFNYDIPNIPETYVHRIGRTARAGNKGTAIAFCAPDERGYLKDIERLIRKQVPVQAAPEGLEPESRRGGRGRSSGNAGNTGGGGQRNSRGGGGRGGQSKPRVSADWDPAKRRRDQQQRAQGPREQAPRDFTLGGGAPAPRPSSAGPVRWDGGLSPGEGGLGRAPVSDSAGDAQGGGRRRRRRRR